MDENNLESRIELLEKELLRIRKLYDKAILYQKSDPEVALAQARKSAEAICKHIYIREGLEENSKPAAKMMLNDLVGILSRSGVLPAHIYVSLGTIQNYGNFGTHDQGTESDFITEEYIRPCLQALNTVVHWYFTKYAVDSENAMPQSETDISIMLQNEQSYYDAFEIAFADSVIDPAERTLLNRKHAALNISVERAKEIEQSLINKKSNTLPPAEILAATANQGAETPPENRKKLERNAWRDIVLKKMVAIPEGSFLMGSASGNKSESTVHKVAIVDFCMMKCLVTQRDYEKVCGTNPSNFIGDANRPVESVSWFDAIAFCNKWSRQDGLELVYEIQDDAIITRLERNGYRLPTEAEWEYACRAGSTTDFFWGKNEKEADQYAWYDTNSEDVTHSVGTKRKNSFGLYDMVGNLWEWVNDWFNPDYYSESAETDPAGPEFGQFRALRGGCWFNGVSRLRSFCRLKRMPNLVDDVTGFRCVSRYIK